jgi:hypothetical protein
MSIKLEQALATKKVLVQKIVSGEVTIHFKDHNVKDVILSHNGIVDLLAKRGVTPDAVRSSNLKELYLKNLIKIL